MKKLLVLGGSHVQIPIIKKAKEMGNYVIVCDYRADIPGRDYAHEFHHISATDRDKLLLLAESLNIDGVVSYASDLTTVVAAFLAEHLNLPYHPLESVRILSNKEKFRRFLREHDFNTPLAKAYQTYEEAYADFHRFKLPVMIKPVDSSGSRGVAKIESISCLQEKVECALQFSRAGRFLLEEYIESNRFYHVGGEGFSVNGELVFSYYFNEHFPDDSPNPFVSIGASYPCFMSDSLKQKIDDEIQRLFYLLRMETGAFNFEIRIDDMENVYLIEVAARNGVGYQKFLRHTTGFDIDENIIHAALGNELSYNITHSDKYWAMYGFYSNKDGIFKEVKLQDISMNDIVEYEEFVRPGDHISALTGADKIIGYMIFKSSSKEKIREKLRHVSDWLQVIVDE